MKDRKMEEKPPCSAKTTARPLEVKCPNCGDDVELWSDEKEVRCKPCGHMIAMDDFSGIKA